MKKPSKEYMNNTEVAKVISQTTGLIDTGSFDVGVLPKKGIMTTVDLTKDEHIQLSSSNITPYDMAVMDSVYTLLQSGYNNFTPQMILRVLSGNMDQDATPQKVGAITKSINKMRHVDITIDCTEELRVQKKIKPKETAKYKSYLMPVSEIEIRSGNQKIMHGYKLLEKPALYVYAEVVNRIVDVPFSLLEQDEISDSDEVIVIKRYLIQYIESMKNNENIKKKIRLLYDDSEEGTGMYEALGYKATNYSNWKKKKSKINSIVKAILAALKKQGYIKNFEEYTEKQAILGIDIKL